MSNDSPTAGLSPLMDMRVKLTKAEKRIAELETLILSLDCEHFDGCGTSPRGTPGKRGYDNGKCRICNYQAALKDTEKVHYNEYRV